jgi:hypothetical protein
MKPILRANLVLTIIAGMSLGVFAIVMSTRRKAAKPVRHSNETDERTQMNGGAPVPLRGRSLRAAQWRP